MADGNATREVTINLRARIAQRELIDRAARTRGETRTEFMLNAASQKAQEVLLDTTLFSLGSRQFARFVELLDAPAKPSPGLRKLLTTRAPWER